MARRHLRLSTVERMLLGFSLAVRLVEVFVTFAFIMDSGFYLALVALLSWLLPAECSPSALRFLCFLLLNVCWVATGFTRNAALAL